MALETYIESKQTRRGRLLVGFNKKRLRLTLHKPAKDLLTRTYGPVNYILIKFDPNIRDSFWIMPCSEKERGAKKLSSSVVSISENLSKKMGLDSIPKESGNLKVSWDSEYNAAKVEVAAT